MPRTEYQVEKNILFQPELTRALVFGAAEQGKNIQEKCKNGTFKRVVLFGLGSSHHVAEISAYALRDLASDHSLEFLSSHSLFPFQWRSSDLAIAVTHRGGSAPTRAALQMAKKAGATGLVVCAKNAPSYPEADVVWRTGEIEKIEPHTLALSGAIGVILSGLLGKNIAELWEEETFTLEKVCNEIDVTASAYQLQHLSLQWILGEGIGEFLAKEWALKLMEMAALRPIAMSTEAFFHGPKWSAQSSDKVGFVKIEKDNRTSSVAALSQPVFTVSVPNRPLGFLEGLLKIQYAALGAAIQLKINPDTPENRF